MHPQLYTQLKTLTLEEKTASSISDPRPPMGFEIKAYLNPYGKQLRKAGISKPAVHLQYGNFRNAIGIPKNFENNENVWEFTTQ